MVWIEALALGESRQQQLFPLTCGYRASRRLYVRRERRGSSVGKTPTRQLSLQPVAIGVAAEVTKQSKPLV